MTRKPHTALAAIALWCSFASTGHTDSVNVGRTVIPMYSTNANQQAAIMYGTDGQGNWIMQWIDPGGSGAGGASLVSALGYSAVTETTVALTRGTPIYQSLTFLAGANYGQYELAINVPYNNGFAGDRVRTQLLLSGGTAAAVSSTGECIAYMTDWPCMYGPLSLADGQLLAIDVGSSSTLSTGTAKIQMKLRARNTPTLTPTKTVTLTPTPTPTFTPTPTP